MLCAGPLREYYTLHAHLLSQYYKRTAEKIYVQKNKFCAVRVNYDHIIKLKEKNIICVCMSTFFVILIFSFKSRINLIDYHFLGLLR